MNATPPSLIYLDLNHWIGLAKARVGHRDGADYMVALQALTDAVEAGSVTVPLSAVHYEEIAGIKDVNQRTDVALAMASLSRYRTLASRETLLRAELMMALRDRFGLAVTQALPAQIIGYGFAFAFGQRFGRLALQGDPSAKEQFYRDHGAEYIDKLEEHIGFGWKFLGSKDSTSYEELVDRATNEAAQFVILRGPAPEDLPGLKLYGYDPETPRRMVEAIAERERDLATQLAKNPKARKRLDDILAARVYVWDLSNLLPTALGELGLGIDALRSQGKPGLTEIIRNMPIVQVELALRRTNFKNDSYRWRINDIRDLAALGPAVPYCDIVITEKHAAFQLSRAQLAARYKTVILRRIDDVLPFLPA